MVNPRVLEIFHNYYNILLSDYIYHYNQFTISLFNIVRVSEMSATIQVVYIFIKFKKKANYL